MILGFFGSYFRARLVLRVEAFHGCGLFLWRIIPFAIIWSRERNERIFRGSLFSVVLLVAEVIHMAVK